MQEPPLGRRAVALGCPRLQGHCSVDANGRSRSRTQGVVTHVAGSARGRGCGFAGDDRLTARSAFDPVPIPRRNRVGAAPIHACVGDGIGGDGDDLCIHLGRVDFRSGFIPTLRDIQAAPGSAANGYRTLGKWESHRLVAAPKNGDRAHADRHCGQARHVRGLWASGFGLPSGCRGDGGRDTARADRESTVVGQFEINPAR